MLYIIDLLLTEYFPFEMELLVTCVVMDFAGGYYDTFCGVVQYSNLYGTAVGYTIAASISMM